MRFQLTGGEAGKRNARGDLLGERIRRKTGVRGRREGERSVFIGLRHFYPESYRVDCNRVRWYKGGSMELAGSGVASVTGLILINVWDELLLNNNEIYGFVPRFVVG